MLLNLLAAENYLSNESSTFLQNMSGDIESLKERQEECQSTDSDWNKYITLQVCGLSHEIVETVAIVMATK